MPWQPLSMRAGGCLVVVGSVAEYWLHKSGALGLIPSGCQPFHFPLLHLKTSKIYILVNTLHTSFAVYKDTHHKEGLVIQLTGHLLSEFEQRKHYMDGHDLRGYIG